MDTLLKGISRVIPLFHNILIMVTSDAKFTIHLQEVLSRFKSASLWDKQKMCFLVILKVEFLGYFINAEGHAPHSR